MRKKESVFHLSSSMCAEHRLNVLGKAGEPEEGSIRYRLKNGLACRLVATQVVGSRGGHRFSNRLPCSGAARCHRSSGRPVQPGRPIAGKRRESHSWPGLCFSTGRASLPPGVYTTATTISEAMVRDIVDSEGNDGRTFRPLFQTAVSVNRYRLARQGQQTIQEERAEFHFREVSAKAKVITEDGRPVVVPYLNGAEHIQDIRNPPAGSRPATL